MAVLFTILLLVIFFNVLSLIFKLCGKLVGMILGIVGYIVLGCFLIAGLGLAVALLPIFLLAGILIFFGALTLAF